MRHAKEGIRPQVPAGGRENTATGHGRKSNALRQRAILALLTAETIGQAAEQCGAGERTLRRWLRDDAAFRAEYDAARTETYLAGMHRIQGLTGRAVDTLADLLVSGNAPTVRLGAARTVLEMAIHEHDTEAIIKRLNEIEAVQRSRKR